MKGLDRITVCNEARRHDWPGGRLSIRDQYARLHIPTADLPDKDVHAMDVVASANGEVLYTGSVWSAETRDTHMGQKVVLQCLPAEAHDT